MGRVCRFGGVNPRRLGPSADLRKGRGNGSVPASRDGWPSMTKRRLQMGDRGLRVGVGWRPAPFFDLLPGQLGTHAASREPVVPVHPPPPWAAPLMITGPYEAGCVGFAWMSHNWKGATNCAALVMEMAGAH
jgi:hypothetical protein